MKEGKKWGEERGDGEEDRPAGVLPQRGERGERGGREAVSEPGRGYIHNSSGYHFTQGGSTPNCCSLPEELSVDVSRPKNFHL